MPAISIIVPVYQVKNYLPRCIDSLIAQTFEDIEIILVDDASSDGSGEICDAYAKKDPRIRVIHQEHGGLSVARNTGLAAARGEWLMFVDSDDYVLPDFCRRPYQYALEQGGGSGDDAEPSSACIQKVPFSCLRSGVADTGAG